MTINNVNNITQTDEFEVNETLNSADNRLLKDVIQAAIRDNHKVVIYDSKGGCTKILPKEKEYNNVKPHITRYKRYKDKSDTIV